MSDLGCDNCRATWIGPGCTNVDGLLSGIRSRRFSAGRATRMFAIGRHNGISFHIMGRLTDGYSGQKGIRRPESNAETMIDVLIEVAKETIFQNIKLGLLI